MADSSGSARHRLNGSRNADSESAHGGPSTEHWPRSRWWLVWWRWKWRWTGGETPPMHRGHLPEPPSPIQPLPSADCALFPQPEAEKKQKTTENLPLKNTKEKPEQQRSGHPPPQHLGELLLFSGCSPRPLDIRGSRASRKRWRGRRKKKNTRTRTRRLRSGMSADEDGDSPHCGTGSMSAGAAEETPPPSMRDQTWLLAPSIHGAPVSVRLYLRIRSPRHQWWSARGWEGRATSGRRFQSKSLEEPSRSVFFVVFFGLDLMQELGRDSWAVLSNIRYAFF